MTKVCGLQTAWLDLILIMLMKDLSVKIYVSLLNIGNKLIFYIYTLSRVEFFIRRSN